VATHFGDALSTQSSRFDGAQQVRHAETRDLGPARPQRRDYQAARSGKATRDELMPTITITSLGACGIVTSPVINHPEVAIVVSTAWSSGP
jgi:pyruvate/2-oxoglutarate dehydrogenase complex dihydrolipoamide acyltransferase (E2) component